MGWIARAGFGVKVIITILFCGGKYNPKKFKNIAKFFKHIVRRIFIFVNDCFYLLKSFL